MAVGWADELEQPQAHLTDLTELSLEELMNIEVTSVSKKSEKLSEAAAAIYVITQEDIRRAGVTSIPEALRMVPGLQVARIDANKWAISSRGFNDRFANKLLVLIDGRSVYTPLFSGVYWEMQDTLLEDMERIEVIRGPGATLWGANAVNGVINIITKSAKDTQGGLVAGGGGTEERGFSGLRYGGKLGDNAHYRVYAKYFNRDSFVDASGNDTADIWDAYLGGFQMGWKASEHDSLTLQGDVYNGDTGATWRIPSLSPPLLQRFDANTDLIGANVLGRWTHISSEASDLALQVYYDRTERESPAIDEKRDTFDIDFQHRFGLSARQELVWGLGYRLTSDDTGNRFTVSLNPPSRADHLFSAFIQDTITLAKDRLRLTVGSKFEQNDYTGFEIQPNARLLWLFHERHTVWSAVSRAVRTPSRVEDDVRINRQALPPGALSPKAPLALVSLFGNRDFESEDLLAYELGYRVRPRDGLFLDIATFYNVYDNLRTLEPGNPFPEGSPTPPHLVVPFSADNKMEGATYGVELATDWQVLEGWRLRLGYSYLQMQLRLDEGSGDTTSEDMEDEIPHHQLFLRSLIDLPGNLEFDLGMRYVDSLPNLNVGDYLNLDVRLGWKPIDYLEISVAGQNLLDNHHLEITPKFIDTLPTEGERGGYGAITWRF